MTGAPKEGGPWRNSYDVDDARAQVSTIYWEEAENNANALRFFEIFTKTVARYSSHIRESGKQLPISINAMAVLEALFSVMDGKTGRCEPCLDTIAKRCGLSRRTVVRVLQTLRDARIIDWVHRTVKTGNAKGAGPQRQQTSNTYFIDMLKLPAEIARTLRQKLGDKLREKVRHLQGSGGVPNRMAIKAERLLKAVTGALSTSGGRERAERCGLAGGTHDQRLIAMYGGDLDAIRQHEEMQASSSGSSASATLALYPPLRTRRKVD